MDAFEITEHTAEVGFRAHGTSLDEAFEHSGAALFAVMAELDDIPQQRELSFEITAEGQEALLYDFLDHLLYLRDTENMLFSSFDVAVSEQPDGYSLAATVAGADAEGIPAQDVKAPTYSDMVVREDGGEVVVQVVLDV